MRGIGGIERGVGIGGILGLGYGLCDRWGRNSVWIWLPGEMYLYIEIRTGGVFRRLKGGGFGDIVEPVNESNN
jgi:hypothetical protein